MKLDQRLTALTLAVERRHMELAPLLADLIAAGSEVGATGEAAQQVCARYLSAAGYRVTLSVDHPLEFAGHAEYTPPAVVSPAVNLVAMPPHTASQPLALLSHIDTEPAHAVTTPAAERRGTRLYGLGAADAKGGLAAAMVAAAILSDAGEPAPIVMSVHAKGGGARGTLPVFVRAPRLGGVIYVHPAETGRGLAEIKHATRGLVDVCVSVQGWQGAAAEIGTPESARWDEGGNALAACLRIVERLHAQLPRGCEVNVGRLIAGDSAGTVPMHAVAALRVLFDEPLSAAEVEAAADVVLEQQRVEGRGERCTVTIGVERRANPAATAWNDRLCLALRTAVTRVTGVEPSPYRAHLGSDLRFPIRIAGAPAVGVGALGGGFYGPDEWVDLDDLQRTVRVLVDAARVWNARELQ